MAFGVSPGGELYFFSMVLDPELSHTHPPRFDGAETSLRLFLTDMLFDVTMNEFRDHLDIAAAKGEHGDCVEDGEAHRLVFGAVRDGRQIQELGSGAWRARLEQHVVAKVEVRQGIGEILRHCSQ
jgi:hypothetical protein